MNFLRFLRCIIACYSCIEGYKVAAASYRATADIALASLLMCAVMATYAAATMALRPPLPLVVVCELLVLLAGVLASLSKCEPMIVAAANATGGVIPVSGMQLLEWCVRHSESPATHHFVAIWMWYVVVQGLFMILEWALHNRWSVPELRLH